MATNAEREAGCDVGPLPGQGKPVSRLTVAFPNYRPLISDGPMSTLGTQETPRQMLQFCRDTDNTQMYDTRWKK